MEISNYLIYLRKSRADSALETVEEVLSKHESILQRFCEERFGCKMPESNIYREVVSGEMIDERPMFLTVLDKIEKDNIEGVIVVEPQRLSRGDLEECGRVTNIFRYTKTLVVTPNRTFDLAEEFERKFFEMELTRGNDYLEYTKRILIRGREEAVKNGWYISPNAPYGYKKKTVKINNKTYHTLEPDENADAIRLIFDLFANKKYSYHQIGVTLLDLGYKPVKLDYWSKSSLHAIIKNPTYAGKIRAKQTTATKIIENGEIKRKTIVNPSDSWELYEGKHEALISFELWQKAFDRFKSKKPLVKNNFQLRNPFASIMYCSKCGKALKLKKSSIRRKEYFLCMTETCDTHSVQSIFLYERIQAILMESIKNFDLDNKQEYEEKEDLKRAKIKAYQKDIDTLKKRDLRQKDAYEDGIYTKEEYLERNIKLQNQIQSLKSKIKHIKEEKEIIDYDKLSTFKDCIDKLTDSEFDAKFLNDVFLECIERIEYTNNTKYRSIKDENIFDLEVKLKI